MTLLLNPAFRITPLDGSRVRVKLIDRGFELDATPYQARLLAHFAAPTTVEAVLGEFPFETAESRAFLEAARAGGVLLPCDPQGRLGTPDVVEVARSFMGAPPFDPAAPAPFTVVGAPADLATSGLPGARFGPAAIREASEATPLGLDPSTLQPRGIFDLGAGRWRLAGVGLQDAGDVVVAPGEPLHAEIGPRLARTVRKIWDAGSIPLLLGGDHALTYYALSACQAEQVGVVHFDAHTDLGEPEPVLHHGNVFTHVLDRLGPVVGLWQAGLRGFSDTDPGEDERVHGLGIDALRAGGLDALIDRIPRDLPVYLSVDIDVLDPSIGPATGTPVPGGLLAHELMRAIEAVCAARRVIGVDVMEVAAPSGPHDGTAGLALQALLTAADGIVQHLQGRLQAETDEEDR